MDRASGSVRENLCFASLYKLRFNFLERGHLQFQCRYFLFQPHAFRFCGAGVLSVGAMELCQVTTDARFDLFYPSLEFRVGEIAIAAVHRLEFAAVDSDDRIRKKVKLLAQNDELTAYIADRFTVVFSEVGDGLAVRFQTPGQPHQFDVPLRFALQAPARLNKI